MTEIIKKEKNTVHFNMILKAEDVKKAEDEAYKKNKKYFQIPGFRKGHAPRKMIENMYGKEVFLEDAINETLPKYYEAAIKELGLETVDKPEINIEEANSGEDIKVEVSVEIKPEVKLGEYKGVEVEDVVYEVTEELIESELDNQRQMNARLINIDDRTAQIGDKVNIDFKGFVDGEEFVGGSAEGQDLDLGSNTFIEGFETQIVGHNVGDEFDVNVTFPKEYFSEELQNKDATFKVKLNSISYEELPEIDDEFIKDISDFDTVEEYKNDIRAKKEEEFAARTKSEKEDKVVAKVVENIEVEVPNAMVEQQMDAQIENFDRTLKGQGMGIEEYVKMLGTTMEAFRETLRADALNQVKTSLALEAVAIAEGIEVLDEEIEAEVDKMVKDYFPNEEAEQGKMKKYMLDANKDAFKESLINKKAVEILFENAKFIEEQSSCGCGCGHDHDHE